MARCRAAGRRQGALGGRAALGGQLPEPVQHEPVPGQLRADPQPGMLDDQVIGHCLVRPGPVLLPVDLCGLRGQRPDPVIQVAAEQVLIDVAAHREREIDRVGAEPDLLEGLTAQGPELPGGPRS